MRLVFVCVYVTETIPYTITLYVLIAMFSDRIVILLMMKPAHDVACPPCYIVHLIKIQLKGFFPVSSQSASNLKMLHIVNKAGFFHKSTLYELIKFKFSSVVWFLIILNWRCCYILAEKKNSGPKLTEWLAF